MKRAQLSLVISGLLVIVVVLVAILILVLLTNQTVNSITGSFLLSGYEPSDVITRDFDLENFYSVEVRSSADLFITQGSSYKVSIQGEENVIDKLSVFVDGGNLVIGRKSKDFFSSKKIIVFVSLPSVSKISFLGSGDISSTNTLTSSSLSLLISGFSSVNLDVDVDELKTVISGSSDILYSGSAIVHDLSVSGSADVNSRSLITKDSFVSISGSSDVKLFSSDNLDVKISGFGSVYYDGNPRIRQSTSGSGIIKPIE